MKYTYVLQHEHVISEDNEDVKFIGAYSYQKEAEKAIARLKVQPGFAIHQKFFVLINMKLIKIIGVKAFLPTRPQKLNQQLLHDSSLVNSLAAAK
jgi:hypothetical protein